VIAKPLIINLFECLADIFCCFSSLVLILDNFFSLFGTEVSAWHVARKHYATRVVHLEVLMCLRRIERQIFSTVALKRQDKRQMTIKLMFG
jgi:hypothetical protein